MKGESCGECSHWHRDMTPYPPFYTRGLSPMGECDLDPDGNLRHEDLDCDIEEKPDE